MNALACLVLALGAFVAQGPAGIPKNDGWVTDLADMLPAQREAALEARMESYRAGSSGAEIAVLTVPSLNGEPLEDFARKTGRAWGIGSKATKNGALLVVARDEHELRIEVGPGLEGEVTDAMGWRVIQQVIVPKFKAGDFAGGIEDGVLALHQVIGGDYGAIGGRPTDPKRVGQGAGPALIVMVILAVAVAQRRRRRGGGFRGPFGGGGFPGGLIALGGLRGLGGRGGGGFSGGGFGGFGGGGGFSGGGASGRW